MTRTSRTDASGRYLVVGPAWVGDMVMAQSLFKTLVDRQPGVHISVLAPEWTRALTERMPEVAATIASPVGHGQLGWGERRAIARQLRGEAFTDAIILPGSLKSALIPFWAGVPRRTGYRGEWRYGLVNHMRTLDKSALPRTVQRFVALGMPADAPAPPDCPLPRLRAAPGPAAATLAALGLERPAGPWLALCPGAEYGSAKRWPEEYFAEVARCKREAGWTVWLLGSARDATVTRSINRLAGGGCVDLAGRTTLTQVIDLLSQATGVVTNDSGLMHIAAALDRKVVAVFGSSSPAMTPPLHPDAVALSLGLSCSPCFRRECPLQHTNCLRRLEPARVLDALADHGPRAETIAI